MHSCWNSGRVVRECMRTSTLIPSDSRGVRITLGVGSSTATAPFDVVDTFDFRLGIFGCGYGY